MGNQEHKLGLASVVNFRFGVMLGQHSALKDRIIIHWGPEVPCGLSSHVAFFHGKEKTLPFSVEDKMSAYFKVFIFAYVRVHLEGAVIREK